MYTDRTHEQFPVHKGRGIMMLSVIQNVGVENA